MVWCIWAASSVMAVISLGCQSRRFGKPQKTGVCAPCAPLVLIHPPIIPFGEFIEGTITEVELPASVQPLDLQDADIAGGVSLVERLRIYVPEPDALRAAFDDAGADAVAWLGLEFTVEESRSWPGSHTRATVLRET